MAVIQLPWIAIAKRLPWRWIGTALAVLAATAWIWHSIVSYGDRREVEGKAHVQARWDADEAEEKRVADAATLAAQLQDTADAARNKEIADAHQKDLAAATADRDRYRGLLRQARAAASAVPAGEIAGESGTAEASPPGSAAEAGDLAERIDAAIADVMVEARQNADQLDALREQVIPQM